MGDANILITANSQDELLQRFNNVLNHMSKWFQRNWLNLNPTKTKYLKFTSAEVPNALNLTCADHLLLEVETIKFLGLQLDGQITWKNHIHLLLGKLSSTCFLMGQLYYILNIDSLKLIYFANFPSIVRYGIIFWSNQHDVNKVFILQKKILRIMLGLGYRCSGRSWFKQFEISTVPCVYFYSLAMFVTCNSSYFKNNISVHSLHTRQINHLHKPLVKFTPIQRGTTYSTIKVRDLINCHLTVLSFNMTKCRSRLH